jgi:CheY-like chemotaxis protein/PAS domain-containing protein
LKLGLVELPVERADIEQWKSKEVARLLALVETERRYWQEIVSTLPVPLAILSSNLFVLSANRAFRATFNLRNEDLRLKRIDDVLDSQELKTALQSTMESRTPGPAVYLEIAGGRRIRASVLPHRDWDEDSAIHALLILENLETQDSGANSEASAAASKATPLPVSLPAVVWTAELPSMQFTFVSSSAQEITGVSPERWKQPDFWKSRISEPDRDAVIAHYAQFAKPATGLQSCEFRLSDNPRWFRETIRMDPDGKHIHGILTDITERRSLEEHLLQSQRVEALATFAGRAAHDLNNPLMIVSGYGEEIFEALPQGDPRREDMHQVINAAKRMSDLTASMQSFSRKQPSPSLAGAPALINLNTALSAAVDRLRASAPGFTIHFHAPDQELEVRGDPKTLDTLFREVAMAMAEGNPHAHLAIRGRAGLIQDLALQDRMPHNALQPGSYAVLLFDNVGVETPGVKRPIFESVLASPELARIYRVVETWGGSMWAATNNRQVRILLPAPAHEAVPPSSAVGHAVAEAAALEPQAPPPPPPKRILVVDNEMGIRTLMRKILLREGYAVFEADGAKEALKILENDPQIDLLLTDVVMPEVSGRELAEQAVAKRPALRVLYVSGFTDTTQVETGQFPPGSQLLQKPFTLGTLLRRVKEVLGAADDSASSSQTA